MADEDLMVRYQGGDSAAFEALFNRHSQSVYRFILGFTRNRQAAEDAFQEVFLRVIRASARYEPRAKFSTWVFRIARNLCTDLYRRRKGLKLLSLEEKVKEAEGSATLGEMLCQKHRPSLASHLPLSTLSRSVSPAWPSVRPGIYTPANAAVEWASLIWRSQRTIRQLFLPWLTKATGWYWLPIRRAPFKCG